ncbi:MAG: phosphate acyltransferase PlsX [Planctomycetota bacterium]|nr:phosphate acyltransferase PlsX [Planctomycetota bacterium]
MPHIAVDAMGGDLAPAVPVRGAIRALSKNSDLHVTLVGLEQPIAAELDSAGGDSDRLHIQPCSEWVTMEESPVEALRNKPDSSLAVMVGLLKQQKVDAIYSAGNTGAMVAACSMQLRMQEGVRRPAIALPLPRGERPVMLCDGGANVECKPIHLLQNAIMATAFLRRAYGVENPKVGLLNVGSEKDKGHTLAKETHELLASSSLSFAGNVEGGDIFQADLDVVVCDGFVGNIVLKSAEGFSEALFQLISSEMGTKLDESGLDLGPLKALLQRGLRKIRSRFDYAEYGGAPLLGPRGVCTIGHGRSDDRAISNGILWTLRMVETGVQQEVIDSIHREMELIEHQRGEAESLESPRG